MKIGIRCDAGEAGGWQTLQSAELARQVRMVGIAVLDGEQRPARVRLRHRPAASAPARAKDQPSPRQLADPRLARPGGPGCAWSAPAAAKAARSARHRAGRAAQRGGGQSFTG